MSEETNKTAVMARQSCVSVSLMLDTLPSLREFCGILSKTEMVPKAYRGKPDDILVAMLHGQEVGLPHLQALQSIATINGVPSIYGDAGLALVRTSGKLEDFDEWFEVDGVRQAGSSFPIQQLADAGKQIVAHCLSKRVGAKRAKITTYSVNDAKRAGLWAKEGPWASTPQRMLMFRARGWNLRDEFGDVLKGLSIYEEAMDIETTQGHDGSYRPVFEVIPPDQSDAEMERVKKEMAQKQPPAAKATAKPAEKKPEPKPEPTPEPKAEQRPAAGESREEFERDRMGSSGSAAAPVAMQDGYPAQWLSDVIEAEDYLRGSEAGSKMLRAIREGFKLEADQYPMLVEHQAEYLDTVKRSAKRLGAK